MVISWQEFVAGWIAGVGGLSTSHPIDTMKVRYQNNPIPIMTTIRDTFLHEGPHGFYKGMMFPALMSGIQNSVFFGAYANSLRYITGAKEVPGSGDIFWAGCAASQLQVFVTTPIEVIKVKLQMSTGKAGTQTTQHTGIWKTIVHTYEMEGLRGIYKGFWPTVMRDVPTGGFYMLIYVDVDYWLIHKLDINPWWSHLTAGGLAGSISFAPVIPFDYIKNRMQADDAWCPTYRGFFDVLTKSLQKDGFSSLFRGFGLNSVRSFVSNATIFIVYEMCLLHLYS